MKSVYVDVFQFRGSHYDFGYWQGEQLCHTPIIANRRKQWEPQRERHFIVNVREFERVMLEFSPKLLEEINGLVDALKMDLEDAIVQFGGFYLEYGRSGCSILTGFDYFVRNYDNEPQTYEGRYVLYQPTDGGYATIGPTMQVTGRTDGMNERGLVVGYNFVNRKMSGDGFICNMICRIVLENCANVEEAISLLKSIPHRHSFNYVLLDKRGQTFIVEASPRQVKVRQGNYCTNHFELLLEENRYQMDDSLARYEVMNTTANDLIIANDAFTLLNDKEKGVFSEKYGAWAGTIHTSAYFPKAGQAWLSVGANQQPVIFNFSSWLTGKDSIIKKVKGKLKSKTVFVNMEEIV
ncbi:C45 family autoproteolytic acyltransferase/hydolase [Bacillus kwashiorkori]|uniref:C45 family autoproteolytic acyltransferase/hydolase n=1 Tax=Bacillus kwashiorkori TaxID=1522318 RepID=UPI0007828A73|nr:C45 family peptidase [Bacillus kwashiorkori]